MRRRALTTVLFVVALWLASTPSGRGPSVQEMFVAGTQAAAEAETMCLMPDSGESIERGGESIERSGESIERSGESIEPSNQEPRLAIPTITDLYGDSPPLRMVVDPYPSFNGVAVDAANDLVLMS